MSRILLATFIFSLLMPDLKAQRNELLQFKDMVFDFGEIEELAGPVEHEFTFLNISDRPVIIKTVRASCGCTTPGWSKEAVPPGGTGFVKARYSPTGRPGAFNKYLEVITEPSEGNIRLYIKGKVNPRPRTVENDYPNEFGQLRSKFRVLNMGRVKLTEKKAIKSFPVYNSGTESLGIDSVASPAHISARFQPEQIPPNSPGQLIVTIDPLVLNELGFHNENLTIWTNEPSDQSMKSFSVYTNMEEYFPPMSKEEYDAAPLINFDKFEHDFGRIKQGEDLSTSFLIVNDGKKELLVRKIETNCSCVSTSIESMKVPPSDSVRLEVSFDTKMRRSRQQKSITIYSNSPKRPVSRLILKAYVEEN